MSLIVAPQILGQNSTFAYLFEPLRYSISESSENAQNIYIDVILTEIGTSTTQTFLKYVDYEVVANKAISIDFAKIAQELSDNKTYIYSRVSDITDASNGWKSTLGKYRFTFSIYSNITTTKVNVNRSFLIGNRGFEDFIPTVSNGDILNEFQKYEVDGDNRWIDYPTISIYVSPSGSTKPTIQANIQTQGKHPCGGYLIWKSKFGGWMHWGFDLKSESTNHSYEGNIESEMFESTLPIGGNPYVPVNYTGISSSRSITMKSLGLTSEELLCVNGIQSSPAIYVVKEDLTMELMRLASATIPLDNLSNGGDFTVSLKSISIANQKTL